MGLQVQILLDNSTNSYYPGETVHGRVVIVNDEFRKAKGLKVKFTGKCEVHFTETKRRQVRNLQDEVVNESYKEQFHAEETYLEYLLNVFGNDGGDVTIPTGRFEYPFQYPLPYNLPASYNGEHGKIFYMVRAEVPRSWAFNCKTSTEFRVLGSVDLGMNGQAQQEGIIRKQKSFGCFGCSSGDATYVLRLEKSGAYIGEFIPFALEINNHSSKTLGARVSLMQKVTFHANGKQRKAVKVICAVDGPSVPPGEDDIWRGSILQVPACVPSGLGGVSTLIDVRYELKMEMTGNGLFIPLEGKAPVIIGARRPDLQSNGNHETRYEAPPPYNPTNPIGYPQAYASAPYNQVPVQANFSAPHQYPPPPVNMNAPYYQAPPQAPPYVPQNPNTIGFNVQNMYPNNTHHELPMKN